MRLVPLAAVPNQSFTLTLDNVRWVLTLKTARGVLVADVDRDGAALLRGVRVLAGEMIIPYRYLQTANFVFLTQDDELPEWGLFGVSQSLVYLTAAEMAALPAMTSPAFVPSFLTDDAGFYLTTDTGALLTDD